MESRYERYRTALIRIAERRNVADADGIWAADIARAALGSEAPVGDDLTTISPTPQPDED